MIPPARRLVAQRGRGGPQSLRLSSPPCPACDNRWRRHDSGRLWRTWVDSQRSVSAPALVSGKAPPPRCAAAPYCRQPAPAPYVCLSKLFSSALLFMSPIFARPVCY